MKTGVLALQGSFFDHVQSLELINQDYVLIKDTSDPVSYTHLRAHETS